MISETIIERMPACCSLIPGSKPGVPFSTTNVLSPFGPSPVLAVKTQVSDMAPFVMKHLLPFTTYSLPSSLARVFIPVGSEPPVGSVTAMDMILSPRTIGGMYFCFCSSLPKWSSAHKPSGVAWRNKPMDA